MQKIASESISQSLIVSDWILLSHLRALRAFFSLGRDITFFMQKYYRAACLHSCILVQNHFWGLCRNIHLCSGSLDLTTPTVDPLWTTWTISTSRAMENSGFSYPAFPQTRIGINNLTLLDPMQIFLADLGIDVGQLIPARRVALSQDGLWNRCLHERAS